MGVQIPLQRIQVPSGQQVLLQDVSWEEFEAILQQLIEKNRSAGRLALRRSIQSWVRKQIEKKG